MRERDRDNTQKTQSVRKKRKREAKTMMNEAAHNDGQTDRQTQRKDGENIKREG